MRTHTRGKKAPKGVARVNQAAKADDWVDSEDEAPQNKALDSWKDTDDEGSSDDELENQKERVINQGVVASAPIIRVLCKAGTRCAYAVIVDLGAGVEGFVPITELAADDEIREALAQRLATIRPSDAPAPGTFDRRPRMRGLIATGPGERSNQIILSGRGERVAEAAFDTVPAGPVRTLLSRLYDRDRVGEAMGLQGLAVGHLIEGSVLQRSTDGVVFSLTPHGPGVKVRNVVGVAVGANAILPAAPGHADPLATPRQAGDSNACPGTPGSVAASEASTASNHDRALKKIRSGAIPCRVLDYDALTGFVDIACTPTVALQKAATDRKATTHVYASLRKKLGSPIPVQVILRKPEYAIVISRPYSGVVGYLALKESDKVKAGDRITAKIEYVRVRPTPQNVNFKAARKQSKKAQGGNAAAAAAAAATSGRTLLDEGEEVDLGVKGTKDKASKAGAKPPSSPASTAADAPSAPRPALFDGWICSEAFAVFTVSSAAAKPAAQPVVEAQAKAAKVTVTDIAPPASKAMGTEDVAEKKAKKRTRDDVAAEEAAAKAEEEAPTSLAEVLAKANATAPAAKVAERKGNIEVGFGFGGGEDDLDDNNQEEAGEPKKKKRKKTHEENELMVDELERARQDGGEPKTVDDFERLVMASPHSSYVWCQFMAFHIAQREVEQARLTAERALKTINYRESEELANVWVAFLNVENLHGTPESLQAVFQRFVQHSDDPMKAYTALTQIGKASDHGALVQKTYQTMLKRFGQDNITPWVDFAQYLLSKGLHEELGKLQKRMLNNNSMSEKTKVDILVKIGCMEYRQGSIDKGRTIFEGLLVKYPKRTDLWSVYLDMEQVVLPRLDDMTRIRNVFDRVTSLNLSSKKMQYFMTRYMTLEKQKGSPERVEYVKKRAIEFVNAKLGDGTEE